MNSRSRLQPPRGAKPPTSIYVGDGDVLDSLPLATEMARRYGVEFPDEQERYGDAGRAWCVHDNLHLLNWAAETVRGYDNMQRQVAWLAGVLESRGYPLSRLARNLDIGADVIRERIQGMPGEGLSAVFEDAASFVRSHGSFRT